jgi:FAD/FMN-containing dehydrogenase
MSGLSRRGALGLAAATLAAQGCSAPAQIPTTGLDLNDASGLSPTRVRRHWRPADRERDLVERLRAEFTSARAAGRPLCIGGARHSMGGQSLAADGTAITLDRGWCEPDTASQTYRASSGVRWNQVIRTLDPLGFTPKVTQANNDFTLGGAFSVNVHGWAVPEGPMGSTVRAMTVMLADGQVVRCSRETEAELFRMAMGGYGLMAVILDLEVEMARNVRLAPQFSRITAGEFGPAFNAAVHEPGVHMAYGRLSVGRDDFLQDAQLVAYRELPGEPDPLFAGESDPLDSLTRAIYRAQIGSGAAKDFRWYAETELGPRLQHGPTTRSRLINTPTSVLAERDPRRTDILHEYFLPPDRLGDFLAACRDVIPAAEGELLNVTLRYVGADRDSVLAFAPDDRVAAVMSFSQRKTQEADAELSEMTRSLIDAALAAGGSFYLPYRLHARQDQLARAYPRLDEFLAAKGRFDPGVLFRNRMWDRYFANRLRTA